MKHYVRVCRPRFEIAVLEIDADDDDQAEDMAVGQAIKLPAAGWHLLSFDDEAYQPHVESCHSEHTIDANVEDEPGEREEYIKELQSPERAEAMHCVRYLLLYADVGTGEGSVIFEPWFPVGEPQLLEHDLAGDWVRELEAIQDEGLENFEDFAAGLAEEEKTAEEAKPDHLRPIIIPFPSGIGGFGRGKRRPTGSPSL
jgi:hypothetical protein